LRIILRYIFDTLPYFTCIYKVQSWSKVLGIYIFIYLSGVLLFVLFLIGYYT